MAVDELHASLLHEFSQIKPKTFDDVYAEIASAILCSNPAFSEGNSPNLYARIQIEFLAKRVKALLKSALNVEADVRMDYTYDRMRNRKEHWLLTVRNQDFSALAKVGVLDRFGRICPGLPSSILTGKIESTIAGLRPAVILFGGFHRQQFEVGLRTILLSNAVGGAMRKLGFKVKKKFLRNNQVILCIEESSSVDNFLAILGFGNTAKMHKELYPGVVPAISTDKIKIAALPRRKVEVTQFMVFRTQRALKILGKDFNPDIRRAGELRLKHTDASIEKLAQLDTPQATKDAMAGRLRRLIHMADEAAQAAGIDDTLAYANSKMAH